MVSIPAIPASRLVTTKQMVFTRSVLMPHTWAAILLPPVANRLDPHRVRLRRICTMIITPRARKKVKEMPSGRHVPMMPTSLGSG